MSGMLSLSEWASAMERNSRFITAIDPGPNTGVVTYDPLDDPDLEKLRYDVVQLNVLDPSSWRKFGGYIERQFLMSQVVIVEDFRLLVTKALSQSGGRMETPQALGAIRLIAAENRFEDTNEEEGRIVFQPPSAQNMWTDAALEKMGFEVPSPYQQHKTSALKHLLHYLWNEKHQGLQLRASRLRSY
jgi:hypothetical protein